MYTDVSCSRLSVKNLITSYYFMNFYEEVFIFYEDFLELKTVVKCRKRFEFVFISN